MAIYTRIQVSDLNKILTPYQIEVVDFTPIEGGNANSNYHIYAKNGEYMMTIAEEKSFHEVQKLTTLLQWLGKHHFLTSQVHATITGEMVTQHAGKPVFVKKWLYGRVHENLTTDELVQIGTSMAQLHQIPVPNYLPKYHPYGQQVFLSVIGKISLILSRTYSSSSLFIENLILFIHRPSFFSVSSIQPSPTKYPIINQ